MVRTVKLNKIFTIELLLCDIIFNFIALASTTNENEKRRYGNLTEEHSLNNKLIGNDNQSNDKIENLENFENILSYPLSSSEKQLLPKYENRVPYHDVNSFNETTMSSFISSNSKNNISTILTNSIAQNSWRGNEGKIDGKVEPNLENYNFSESDSINLTPRLEFFKKDNFNSQVPNGTLTGIHSKVKAHRPHGAFITNLNRKNSISELKAEKQSDKNIRYLHKNQINSSNIPNIHKRKNGKADTSNHNNFNNSFTSPRRFSLNRNGFVGKRVDDKNGFKIRRLPSNKNVQKNKTSDLVIAHGRTPKFLNSTGLNTSDQIAEKTYTNNDFLDENIDNHIYGEMAPFIEDLADFDEKEGPGPEGGHEKHDEWGWGQDIAKGPGNCPRTYLPVCASDGNTYYNDCFLRFVQWKRDGVVWPNIFSVHQGRCLKLYEPVYEHQVMVD